LRVLHFYFGKGKDKRIQKDPIPFVRSWKWGEPLYISPVFDLHGESEDCALDIFHDLMKERASLPNHYVFIGGDCFGAIYPGDPRWTPTTTVREVIQRDDYINATIDYHEQIWKDYVDRVLAIGEGNHEENLRRRHGFDLTGEMARRWHVQNAGYSGYLMLHFYRPSSTSYHTFPIAWHHGAWGGEIVWGMGGAMRYFGAMEEAYQYWFGHNHKLDVRSIPRLSPAGDYVRHRNTFLVCCGGYQKVLEKGTPRYHERKGLPPIHLGSPLIEIRVRRDPDELGNYFEHKAIIQS